MSVILSVLNDRNTITTTGGKHNSISFQKKLAQQQFRKTWGDSLLLPPSVATEGESPCLPFIPF